MFKIWIFVGNQVRFNTVSSFAMSSKRSKQRPQSTKEWFFIILFCMHFPHFAPTLEKSDWLKATVPSNGAPSFPDCCVVSYQFKRQRASSSEQSQPRIVVAMSHYADDVRGGGWVEGVSVHVPVPVLSLKKLLNWSVILISQPEITGVSAIVCTNCKWEGFQKYSQQPIYRAHKVIRFVRGKLMSTVLYLKGRRLSPSPLYSEWGVEESD